MPFATRAATRKIPLAIPSIFVTPRTARTCACPCAIELAREAALATEGEVLWYGGRPIAAYYHRHCGGTTENVRYVWPEEHAPYLRQLTDTFCRGKQNDSWLLRVSNQEFLRALDESELRRRGKNAEIQIERRSPTGRILWMNVAGNRLSGRDFVSLINDSLGAGRLRSTEFEIQQHGSSLVFSGKGDGHGVGMCQVGAEERARAGHSYEDILRFYYPETAVGVNARGFRWRKLSGSRVDVFSTLPGQDEPLVALADAAIVRAERVSRMRIATRPMVRAYPSISAYRDSTGEPGWVAASTVGSVVRMQPSAVLRAGGILESTLLHEFLHIAIDSHAQASLPLWFREGLVQYLTAPDEPAASREAVSDHILTHPASQADLRQAYAAAQSRVKRFVDRYGRARVLGWVMSGLPAALPR